MPSQVGQRSFFGFWKSNIWLIVAIHASDKRMKSERDTLLNYAGSSVTSIAYPSKFGL